MWKETGSNEFFNQFVRDQRKRELKIWQIRREEEDVAATMKRQSTVNKVAGAIDFDDADENDDGVVDYPEFKKVMERNYRSSRIHQVDRDITDDEIKSTFEELDADGSGKIDKDEFDAFQRRYADGANEKNVEKGWYAWYNEKQNAYIFEKKRRQKAILQVLYLLYYS